jgi:crossover junction endodeoxyribonuclease RuvC
MIILGVDPGYATVGCGVLEYKNGKFRAIDGLAIVTPVKMPFEKRLQVIYSETKALIQKTQPDAMAIEELFFSRNQTTGIGVAHARGVILLAAAELDLEPFEYGPMQVKQAVVGYGNAEKRQVMEMTRRILSLEFLPRPDDVADALAIAICHANTAGANRARLSAAKEAMR